MTLIDLLIPESLEEGMWVLETWAVGLGYIITIQAFRQCQTLSNGDSVCLMGLLEGSESRPDALVVPSVSALTAPPICQSYNETTWVSRLCAVFAPSLPLLLLLGTVCVFDRPLHGVTCSKLGHRSVCPLCSLELSALRSMGGLGKEQGLQAGSRACHLL